MPGANKKRDAAARRGRNSNQAESLPSSSGAQPGAYDGPGSNSGEARGRSGSVGRARSSSRPASQVRGSSQAGRGVDPARDPEKQVLLRNVDFGGSAYNIFDQVSTDHVTPQMQHSPCVLRLSSYSVWCQRLLT